MHLHRFRLLYRFKVESALRRTIIPGDWLGARVKVWVDGSELYPRLEKLLSRAKRSIVIQMFLWKDDGTGRAIAALLVEAADRGVFVDVTKDATGDSYELEHDFLSTKADARTPWKRFWNHPRIAVHHLSERDHTKAFIIDGKVLLLGGMNIGDEYRTEWHDYFVEIRGRRFVEGYLAGESVSSPKESLKLILNTGFHKTVRDQLTQLLQSASHRIVLEQAYLSDPAMITLLAARSREGIKVTIILPAHPDIHGHANRAALARLHREGDPHHLHIFLYPKMLHAKLVLVDRLSLFIGSANFITSSLDSMGEANVLIGQRHRYVIFKILHAIRRDLAISAPFQKQRKMWWLGQMLARMGL